VPIPTYEFEDEPIPLVPLGMNSVCPAEITAATRKTAKPTV